MRVGRIALAINKLEILEKYFGYKSFTRGQEKIIDEILKGNDALAIMPSGEGSSTLLPNSSLNVRLDNNSNFTSYISYERPSR